MKRFQRLRKGRLFHIPESNYPFWQNEIYLKLDNGTVKFESQIDNGLRYRAITKYGISPLTKVKAIRVK